MIVKEAKNLAVGEIVAYSIQQMAEVQSVTPGEDEYDTMKIELLTLNGKEVMWRPHPRNTFKIIDPEKIKRVPYVRIWLGGFCVTAIDQDSLEADWMNLVWSQEGFAKQVLTIDDQGITGRGLVVLNKITAVVHGVMIYEENS
jgi:hypothetical protein